MQRQVKVAGAARTTTRGLRPSPLLSEHVSEGLLSRLSPAYDPERRFGQVEQESTINLRTLTMTGHLTGERLA